jgi:predicted nuclease with TOPRIM domain
MRNLHNSSGQGVPTHHNSVKTLGEGLRDPNVN